MVSIEPLNLLMADGRRLVIREAGVQDARSIIEHVERICGESEYLTMGPGDFEMNVEQEEAYLRDYQLIDNNLYIIIIMDDILVDVLSFGGGGRPRVRHSGELAMSVRKDYWGLGLGGQLLDTLIKWAIEGKIVTKINLRVRNDNHRAIRLYERKGFIKEGTIRKGIIMNGRYFDLFWMGLEI